MNCWSHRPRSSRTFHSIDKPLFIRWWPGLFVFTIWSATELKKKNLGEGSHLDPPNIYTMVTPLVGTEACLPWCTISSSFQNSLKMSGHRVYDFLEFWCLVNLVPFMPDIGFQLLKSSWLSLTYFLFNDAPNVLWVKDLEHLDSFTMNPCCCNSWSMWFGIVLLKYTRPSLK